MRVIAAAILLGLLLGLLFGGLWLVVGGREAVPLPERLAPASRPGAPDSLPVRAEPALREATAGGDITVQVVDRDGAPRPGIDVAFAYRPAQGRENRRWPAGRTSAPLGLVVLREVRGRFEWFRKRHEGLDRFGVVIDGFGLAAEVVPLDVEHLPTDPLRLVLPPCGSVLAQVVDGQRQPVLQDSRVDLTLLAADGQGTDEAWRGQTGLEPGPLRFAAFGLGRRFRAHCAVAQLELRDQVVAGPVRDGEEVTVTWTLPPELPILSGLVLTADRAPVRRCVLQGSAWVAGQGSNPVRMQTDEHGRFRRALDPRCAGKELQIVTLDELGPQGLTGRRAFAPFALRLTPGAQDLGNFLLEELPLLLRITVVDGSGGPLEQATVEVAHERDRSFRLVAGSLEMPLVRPLGPGRSELLGRADEGPLVAFVRHDDYLPSGEVPFQRGATDLRVALQKGGRLQATCLVDREVRPTLELHGEGMPRGLEPAREHKVGQQQQCEWSGLPPAAYRLRVQLPTESAPLLVIERLQVEGGKTCDDPRLSSIDLRGLVRRIAIRATGVGGKELTSRDDLRVGMLEAVREAHVGASRGVVTLAFSGASTGFAVGARGYRTRVLRGVDSDVTVTLEPGVAIAARLVPVRLPDGVRVYCVARACRAELDLFPYTSPEHVPGNAVSVGPLGPGAYELVYCASGGVRLASRRIEVLDTSEPQVFEVAGTEPELASALQKLGR